MKKKNQLKLLKQRVKNNGKRNYLIRVGHVPLETAFLSLGCQPLNKNNNSWTKHSYQ